MKIKESTWSKNANICHKCPKDGASDGSRGCPWWWKTTHENVSTNEIKVIEECGKVQLPLFLVEVIKASNRPAAAVESARNEISRLVAEVGRSAPGLTLSPSRQLMDLTARAIDEEQRARKD